MVFKKVKDLIHVIVTHIQEYKIRVNIISATLSCLPIYNNLKIKLHTIRYNTY